jgi:hypothetical protein
MVGVISKLPARIYCWRNAGAGVRRWRTSKTVEFNTEFERHLTGIATDNKTRKYF